LTRGDEAGSGRFVTGAYPEEGEVYPGFPDQNQIDRFIQRHSSVLQRRENVFGTWCVTPAGDCYAAAGPVTCYLDISRETATLEEAAQLAKDCNQISVAQLNQPKVAIIDSFGGQRFGDGLPIGGAALAVCKKTRGE